MKKWIIFFGLLIINVHAQYNGIIFIKDSTSDLFKKFVPTKTTQNINKVLDSAVEYAYSSSQWVPSSKMYVVSRHWGTEGWPHELIQSVYDNSNQQWIPNLKTIKEYYSNYQPRKTIFIAYNTFMNSFKDTVYYLELLPYLNSFTKDSVIKSYFYNDYNDVTQSIDYGYKYDIHLIDDSLYGEIYSFLYNTATNAYDIPYEYQSFEYHPIYLKPILLTYSLWNASTQQYEFKQRMFMIYNHDQSLKTKINQFFSSTWKNLSKEEYTYYSNGKEATITVYTADAFDNFVQSKNDSFYYDAQDNLIKEIHFNWDNVSNQWKYDSRKTYLYNTNHQLTFEQSDSWTGTDWQPDWRKMFDYNSAFKKTLYIYDVYDAALLTWNCWWKETYAYDATDTNLLVSISYSSPDHVNYVPSSKFERVLTQFKKDSISYYYYWTGSDWKSNNKIYYYWNSWDANALSDRDELMNYIYPNPASDLINIEASTRIKMLEIVTISGQLVKVQLLNNVTHFNINIADLPQGRYYLRLTSTQHNQIVKPIIKQ